MDLVETQQRTIEKVVVHPLVLRNIVDNHNSVAKDSGKRVVGVLLGSSSRGIVGVKNSYAVPFEEDDKDPSICILNHKHHESMLRMFKGINDKEDMVGWYSTSPRLRHNDLYVHSQFNGCSLSVQWNPSLASSMDNLFVNVSTEIAAPEVEKIGASTRSVFVTEINPAGVVDMIADYYEYIKNRVRISVEGYDTSMDPVDLDRSLVRHFESCGAVEDVDGPREPITNAINGRCTTVILRGEGAEEKALALNGTDVGGWTVSVKILPPEVSEMSSGMSGREYALRYVAQNRPDF